MTRQLRRGLVTVLIGCLLCTGFASVGAGAATQNVDSASHTAGDGAVLSVTPTETTVAPGETTTIQIGLGSTPASVGAFEFELDVANEQRITIADVEIPGDTATQDIEIQDNNGSAVITATGLEQSANSTLVEITLQGEAVGSTAISLDTRSLTTVDGSEIPVAVERDGTVRVSDATASITPSNATVTPNETASSAVTVSEMPTVGGFTVTFGVTNSSIASIANVTLAVDAELQDIRYDENQRTVTVSVIGGDVAARDATELLTVTLHPNTTGQTDFVLHDITVVDSTGHDYAIPTRQNASLSVQADTGPSALPGFENPPTDPDNDGQFEDLNGNGEMDIGDVQSLFTNRNSDIIRNNVEAFDFNDNGNIDIGDIQALFNEAIQN